MTAVTKLSAVPGGAAVVAVVEVQPLKAAADPIAHRQPEQLLNIVPVRRPPIGR
jgi:hypothetical protein